MDSAKFGVISTGLYQTPVPDKYKKRVILNEVKNLKTLQQDPSAKPQDDTQ